MIGYLESRSSEASSYIIIRIRIRKGVSFQVLNKGFFKGVRIIRKCIRE